MGLSIGVGMLADLLANDPEGAEWLNEGFAAANRKLAEAGLPPHVEPRELPPIESRAQLDGLPYSFIHHLRRAYAHRVRSPGWMAAPLPEGTDPTEDATLEDVASGFDSHLLCHSDAEGFYLPVDFEEVLFAEEDETDLPGGMLGSSYRLLEELVLVAPALGIALSNGQLSDAEAARLGASGEDEEGLYREIESWLLLYESARLSIAHKTAIVFC
ncbi:hypothetical protein VAPA_1c14430 [Variovorax paradoxus B4]|uniref:Uncharacterized protein n=1 Tax=Variovorax paradoxus B4 TaxID=1246301 RepID=T1X8R9_VARPD|nr:hypothetical protein [Variovorax paradoxus]AGU48555.1 hypothetical protein VAPA_1c14430 [Variovorax paradoxus B4]